MFVSGDSLRAGRHADLNAISQPRCSKRTVLCAKINSNWAQRILMSRSW